MTANPAAAAALSALLPGLGQAYNGERSKAVSALAVSVGLVAIVVAMRFGAGVSIAAQMGSVAPIYALIWLPAVSDAYRTAKGGQPGLLGGQSRLYILAMLGCVGPLALPLLWQSPKFGLGGKIAWTAVVLLSIAGSLWLFFTLGPVIDDLLRSVYELQQI
jgi:hypothetical protein